MARNMWTQVYNGLGSGCDLTVGEAPHCKTEPDQGPDRRQGAVVGGGRRGRASGAGVGGGRRGRLAAGSVPARATNYHRLRHPFAPQTVFSLDEVHGIHDTALRVMEELGIKVLLPEARDIYARAGARLEDDMVFIGRDIVAAALRCAPASFQLRSLNPKRAQTYENGAMLFMAAGGCPNVTDRERGRRPGDME